MSKEKIRTDKTCLNCRHVVEKRFCCNCGQENTASRKTFHHLFTHFAEDLVHYDGAFWKTIKALLFQPAVLTKEYLSGRRKTYVPPVKLYIFINFLTFFLLNVLPSRDDEGPVTFNNRAITNAAPDPKTHEKKFVPVRNDSVKNGGINLGHYESVRELDSIEKTKPENEKLGKIAYWGERKLAQIQENTSKENAWEKFGELFQNNLPKVLFIYMPFFAFMLWLFHGKKRWFYFDHGIFTLHYFSFLLLTFSFSAIVSTAAEYSHEIINDFFNFILILSMPLWWFFYFFRSHRRMYMESKLISRLKSFGLFLINLCLIMFFLFCTMMYTALNL